MRSPVSSQVKGDLPIGKVFNTGVVGAIVTIGVFFANKYWNAQIPADVASAITLVLGAITGYLTPLKPHEVVR